MATITPTIGVWSARSAVALERTTLTSTNTLDWTYGCGQLLTIYNTTGVTKTINLKGTAPSPLMVIGFGTIDTSGGKDITINPNGATAIPLDSIWTFLTGTGEVTLTGGAALFATLAASVKDPVSETVTVPEVPTPVAPTEPELAAMGTKVSATNYDDVLWSTTIPAWLEPAVGETFEPRLDIDIPALPANDATYGGGWTNNLYPVCLHLHPAGATYKVSDGGGSLNVQLKQPCLTVEGHIFISATFPHPAITTTASLDDLGKLIQFIRSICPAIGGDPTKIYAVPRSRGNFINVTCMRPDLINPAATTHAGRQSSLLPLVLSANAQGWYSSYKAALANIDDMADAEAFYATGNVGQPIPSMLDVNPAEMVLTAPQVHTFVTNYDGQFPTAQYGSRKVDYTIVGASLHYPGSGETFMESFNAIGKGDQCVIWDNSNAGGDTEQLGYYPRAASEWLRGAKIADAMATAVAVKRGLAAYGIRPGFAGAYQTAATNTPAAGQVSYATPVTAAGQRLGGLADLSTGILNTGVVSNVQGKPGFQDTTGLRTTVVAVANGHGFLAATATTERLLSPQTGSGSDRTVVYWTDTTELTTAGLYAGAAVGFGATNALNVPIVFAVTAPSGSANLTAQVKKIMRFAAKHRTNRLLNTFGY